MVAVHGHRGARAAFAGNTLAGFIYAIEAGCDAIELDVLASRDDVLVVCHDPVLKRRAVREMTFEELRIPTLREVLELAPRGTFQFDVEVKSFPRRPRFAPPPERLAELVGEEIDRSGLGSRVVVLSFDFRVLRAMRRLAPEIRLAALYQLGARDFVSVARDAGAQVVAPYHRLVTARKVAAAHRAGIQVVAWTANRPRDWRRLVRTGVDGIITDDPAGLIEYLRAAGLRPSCRQPAGAG
jgi:glycerophosphoryl diester phosphodiesterase